MLATVHRLTGISQLSAVSFHQLARSGLGNLNVQLIAGRHFERGGERFGRDEFLELFDLGHVFGRYNELQCDAV